MHSKGYHKALKFVLIIVLVCLFVQRGRSQTWYPVNDSNFAQAVEDNYPGIMNPGLTQMDSAKAFELANGIFDMSNRSIIDMDPYFHLKNIDTVFAQNNAIDTINFMRMRSVDYMDISNNGLVHLPASIQWMRTLKWWYLSNNSLTKLPRMDTLMNDTILVIDARNNLINELSDFSINSNLEDVDFRGNRLTFEDMLINVNRVDFETVFKFEPQQKIALTPSVTVPILSDYAILLGIDDTVTGNSYSWFKDGVFLKTTFENRLELIEVSSKDEGDYYAEITNSNTKLNGIKLISESLSLSIEGCALLSPLQFTLEDTCFQPYFNVEPINVDGQSGSFTYSLTHQEDNSVLTNDDGNFLDLAEGAYSLEVSDGTTCSFEFPSLIEVEVPCDLSNALVEVPYVFSPDGDGIWDTYPLPYLGKVVIVDKSGQKVKELLGPTMWDGSDVNGLPVTAGLYGVIWEEGEVLTVTVVR